MAPPVKGPITQGFGPTSEPLDGPYNGSPHFNKGYDYGVPAGTAAQATVGGTVIASGDQGDGWGISVKIRDANGFTHNYGHLSSTAMKVGTKVSPGVTVGLTGSTGKSTGPHLSYDVWDSSGKFIDPGQFVGDGGGAMASTTTSMSSVSGRPDDQADYDAWMKANGPTKPIYSAKDYPDYPGFPGSGQTSFQQAMTEYYKQLSAAASAYNSVFGKQASGYLSPQQQQHQNIMDKIAALNALVNAGQLDASEAATQLQAFIGEGKNALDLTQQQQTANEQMDKYGPGGNWTYGQLGGPASHYAELTGQDQNASGLNYHTPEPFDVAGNYAKNAATMGAGNGAPGGPTPGAATKAVTDLLGGLSTAQTSAAVGAAPPTTTIQPNYSSQPSDPSDPGFPQGGSGLPQTDQNGNPIAPPPATPWTPKIRPILRF